MYKIGEKVETPLGIGVVANKGSNYGNLTGYDIEFKTDYIHYKITMMEQNLKPYVSAHEKLLALGYEYSYKECGDELSDKWHTFYNKKRFITIDVIVNNISGIGWYITFHDPFNCIANIELSRILTQYLEELEAKE